MIAEDDYTPSPDFASSPLGVLSTKLVPIGSTSSKTIVQLRIIIKQY